jgi:hypothetical protein
LHADQKKYDNHTENTHYLLILFFESLQVDVVDRHESEQLSVDGHGHGGL